MSLRRPWPRSLAGRTLLLLLATALLVYLGGILAYGLLAREAAERSRILQIADRLGAAMKALAGLPPSDRAAAARALPRAFAFSGVPCRWWTTPAPVIPAYIACAGA